MKDITFLLVFLSIFAVTSLPIPAPVFSGNWFRTLIGEGTRDYVNILGAILSGAFYGVILWLLFIAIGRKLKE